MAIKDRYTEARAHQISALHKLYNKCWKIYCAMQLLHDPLVDTFEEQDYLAFRSIIALTRKDQFHHPLFDTILKRAEDG